MKKIFFISFLGFQISSASAQNANASIDSSRQMGKVTIIKDPRIDELSRNEAAFNDELTAISKTTAKGYRLMLLSTNDRNVAMKLRTQLLQRFPEQKVYMSFQPPYIKLKFGNFLEKADADNYKKQIIKYKLVTANIYLMPETIEVKPDKNKEKDQ